VCWSIPDPDGLADHLDARKTRLIDVLEDTGTKTLKYLYDLLARNWAGAGHTIAV
jgi:hypothetical protein